jgi:aquaporin Z
MTEPSFDPVKRYLGEFVGTFGLLLFVVGAAVFSIASSIDPVSRVILISFAVGLGLAGLIYAVGNISGGHFNPAVTISLAISGKMPLRDVVPYIVCQVLGGIVGTLVVLGIALGGPTAAVDGAQASALASQAYSGIAGAPSLYSLGAVFLIEVALTFLFISVIQFSTRTESLAKNWAPAAIGFTLLVTNLIAIPVDGASINPARSFAPAVVSLYWTTDHWAIQEVWVFWLAPVLGGILAALFDRAVRPGVGSPDTISERP